MARAADFYGTMVATPAEIDVLFRYMSESERYLEYGSGGTTKMACDVGVQSVFSVETSLDFCRSLIEEKGLQAYISTDRLRLIHASMGPTGGWGVPLSPKTGQLKYYVSLPSKIGDCDLVLIDGRYRVAVAAAAALALAPGGTIMIHDYANRPSYHVVEQFLTRTELCNTLAVFKKADMDEAITRDVLERHLTDYS